MGDVFFYHLTRQGIEYALPPLLQKCLGAGWRVNLRAQHQDFLTWLDEKLWLGPDEGFLPHGLAGTDQDDDQPILLTCDPATPVRDCLIVTDGANVTAAEVQQTQRTCIVFDGNHPDHLTTARQHWKTLTDQGCTAKYWSQESGRWQLVTEKSPASS